MKIRNGFVSNSSSSSFMIRLNDKYKNVLDIAEDMIKDRFDAWRNYDDRDEDHPLETLTYDNIKRLRKNGNVNIPIFFKSTNYDTYIMKLTDNYVFVDTCNNIIWGASDHATYKIPDEVREMYPDAVSDYGEIDLNAKRDFEYYHIENGIMAYPTKEYKSCNKCYDELWVINGVTYCLNCDWEIVSRGLKIEKIKKLIN